MQAYKTAPPPALSSSLPLCVPKPSWQKGRTATSTKISTASFLTRRSSKYWHKLCWKISPTTDIQVFSDRGDTLLGKKRKIEIQNTKIWLEGLLWWSSGWDLVFPLQGVHFWSLIWELKSHKPCTAAKKKKKKRSGLNLQFKECCSSSMLRTKRWNAIECSINAVLSVLVHSVAWSNCSHRLMHSPFLYFSDSSLFLKTCLPFPVFIQNKRTTDLEFRLQTFHFLEENLKAQQGLS